MQLPQHLQYPAPRLSTQHECQAARCHEVSAAQQCSGFSRAFEQHLTLTCDHSIAASNSRDILSGLVSKVTMCLSQYSPNDIDSNRADGCPAHATASERMSEDKADLECGNSSRSSCADNAAAALSAWPASSASGCKSPRLAGTALFALSHTFWKGMHACQRWWLQLCPQDSACSLCNGYEGDSVSF